jgi:SNF2 family DNA or RNA helicase
MAGRLYGYAGHEVATGKTATTLHTLRHCRVILVVCPISVASSWTKQAGIFDPDRRVVIAVDGTSAKRCKAIAEAAADGGRVLIVINYDAVWRQKIFEAVTEVAWDAIVLDEAHRIKGPSSKSSRALARLARSQPEAIRLCLSGTPTPHSPLDWWSQFYFLDPSILGESFSAFRKRVANVHPQYPGWVTGFKADAIRELTARLDPHVHRVKSEDVLDLPDAIHETIEVTLSAKTRKFYADLETDMIAFVEAGGAVTASNRMVVVGRLQSATSGFTRIDDAGDFVLIDGSPAKRLAFGEWLEDFPRAEPLVVFCLYLRDIDEVMAQCRQSGRTCLEHSGREKGLERWQAGDVEVLVVQQQTGGCGIDLTRASFCVYYSLSHSLGDYEQSLARIRRPNQPKCCRYFHLVAKGTVDEDIYSALQEKRDVVESVLGNLTRRVTR